MLYDTPQQETVAADFAAYMGNPVIAFWVIIVLSGVGIIDGLYLCGKKLNNESKRNDINLIIKILCKVVFTLFHRCGRCTPSKISDMFDKAYFYGSILGTTATIPADAISHFNASLKVPIPFINKIVCPGILLTATGIGILASILPVTIKALAQCTTRYETRGLERITVV